MPKSDISKDHRGVEITYNEAHDYWEVNDSKNGLSFNRPTLTAAKTYIDNKLKERKSRKLNPLKVFMFDSGRYSVSRDKFKEAAVKSVVEDSARTYRGEVEVWVTSNRGGKSVPTREIISDLFVDTPSNRVLAKKYTVLYAKIESLEDQKHCILDEMVRLTKAELVLAGAFGEEVTGE